MDTTSYKSIEAPSESSDKITYLLIFCVVVVLIAIIFKFILYFDFFPGLLPKSLPEIKQIPEPTFFPIIDQHTMYKQEEHRQEEHKQEEHRQEEPRQEEHKQEEHKQEESNIATKQIYEKGDEVTLPSSLSQPDGYISRDMVCFRNKLGNIDYMKKRAGCMACQVDSRADKKMYNGTNTNIISSCVYSKDKPDDPSVWTKDQCVAMCAKVKDLK